MPCPYPITLTAGANSIVFNDSFDTFGFWSWSELRGWFGTDLRQTLLEPAGVDGSILAENRKGAKSLVLVGFGGAINGDGWWKAANRLEAVTDALVGTDGTLALAEPTATKTLTVRMSTGGLGVARSGVLDTGGQTGVVRVGFTFQIPLIAANPAKS